MLQPTLFREVIEKNCNALLYFLRGKINVFINMKSFAAMLDVLKAGCVDYITGFIQKCHFDIWHGELNKGVASSLEHYDSCL